MKKILVISDSHGDKNIILSLIDLEKPDYVIHAGDFCVDIEFMNNNVDYFVAGNNDYEGKYEKVFDIDGIRFYLTHGHQYFFNKNIKIANDASKYDASIAITGHTHIEEMEMENNILLINPGSISKPRNHQRVKTYIILVIDQGKVISKEIKII